MFDRRSKLTVAALTGTALALAAAMGPISAQEDESETFDGQWRYDVSCASCHGENGEGISAFGPPIRGNALVMNAPAGSIVQVIQEGRFNRDKAYPEYAGMPSFPYVRAAEARALVDYMKTALQE